MYLPLYTYDNEYRYNAYLSFLIRTRELYNRDGKVTKSVFIQKCGLERKTAHNVWNSGAFVCEYFRGKDGDTLYLAKKTTQVVVRVEKSQCLKVKSLPDFKLFVTALQAAKPNEYGNRSRTLRTIGSKTGTEYKQTVCRRVKKAKKLGLASKQRFIRVPGDKIAQISNSYTLEGVTFHFNKLVPTLIDRAFSKEEKVRARQTKKNATTVSIVPKIGKMMVDSYYYFQNYKLLWSGVFNSAM